MVTTKWGCGLMKNKTNNSFPLIKKLDKYSIQIVITKSKFLFKHTI